MATELDIIKQVGEAIGVVKNDYQALDTQLKQNLATQKDLLLNSKELIKTFSKSKTITDLVKAQEQLAKANDKLEKVQKQAKKTQEQLNKTRGKGIVRLKSARVAEENLRAQNAKNRREAQLLAKAQIAQKGSIEQLNAVTNILVARRAKLSDINGKNKKTYEALTRAILKNTEKQKANDAAIGRSQRNVGNYTGALKKGAAGILGMAKNLAGGVGLTLGIFGLVKAFGSVITKQAEFVKGAAKVQAISGANRQDFNALKQDALDYGAATEKSATQVLGLQEEMAKLGLLPQEIQAATGSIIDLSTAADEDLATSAKVAVATTKQFQLQAKDTSRVADVMAKSFSSSALDLEKFSTAMAVVGPAANSAGESIESTTALLSVLVDQGVDASSAGAALRNIFLDTAKAGITTEEAFERIANSSNKNATAMDLFGKRGAVVAQILALNQKRAKQLTKEYNNSAGAAANMAKIMRDNLAGDTKIAESAMEALQLSIGARLNDALRSTVQGFTNFVNVLNDFVKIKPQEVIRQERIEVNKLALELVQANTNSERRREILTQLNSISPQVVKGIDAENISISQLRTNLAAYNKTLADRLILENLSAEESAIQARIIDKQTKANEAFNIITQQATKFLGDQALEYDNINDLSAALVTQLESQAEKTLVNVQGTNTMVSQWNEAGRALITVKSNLVTYNDATDEAAEISKDLIPLNEKMELQRKLLGLSTGDEADNVQKLIDVQRSQLTQAALLEVTDKNSQTLKQNKLNTIETELDRITKLANAEGVSEDQQRKYNEQIKELSDVLSQAQDELSALDFKVVDKKVQKSLDKFKELSDEAKKLSDDINKSFAEAAPDIDDIGENLDEQLSAALTSIKTNQIDALSAVEEQFANGEIGYTEYQQRIAEINAEFGKKIRDQEITNIQNQLADKELDIDKRAALEKQLADKQLEITKENNKQRIELEKEVQAELATLKNDAINAGLQLITDSINNEVTALEDQFEQEAELEQERLDNENLTTKQRELSEKEFEKNQAEREKQLARKKKQAAITNSIINTAVSVTKTLAEFGIPFGIPLAAIAAAQGAVQTGLIAAQPISAFAKGTDNAPGGKAIVGEEGAELVTEPSGKQWLTPDNATILDIPKGSKINTADETAKIMQQRKDNNVMKLNKNDQSINNLLLKSMLTETKKGNERIVNTIKNSKPDTKIYFSADTRFNKKYGN